MKVLLYVYEWPPIGGGVATAAHALSRQLGDCLNLEVDVITTAVDGRYRLQQLSQTVTVYFLPLGDRGHRLATQTNFDMLFFWLGSYVFSWKLILSGKDYDLTHTFGYPGGLVSWLFNWKWPYLVSLRGVEVPGYNRQYRILYVVYRMLAKVVWKQAQVVVTNSSWLKTLAEKTASSITYQVIGNGIDTQFYKPVSDTNKYNHFTVTAGATVMGKKKGLEYLIDGFAVFHQQHRETRLLLIGDGVDRSRLEAQVHQLDLGRAVRFVGRKDKPWIAKNLPKCHLFCLPSLAEGMSNAILEGMAAGLPIITTKPSQELIQGNGVIVASQSGLAIAQALEQLYTDSRLRHSMGTKSRQMAEKMSWARVAEEYDRLYRRVAKNYK